MKRNLFILSITMLLPIFFSCSKEDIPTSPIPTEEKTGNMDVNGRVSITDAGSLSSLIFKQKDTITTLTLTGKIDARDVQFMRDSIPKLAALDISEVTIQEYTGRNGTFTDTSYPINEMPAYSFYNSTNPNKTLTAIKLPNSVYSIGKCAFKSCTELSTIINGKSVRLIRTDAFYGCIKLVISKTIHVTYDGLSDALTSTELLTVNNLTITGTLDARDFVTLRDHMLSLAVLDISEVNIHAYYGLGGTYSETSYPANELPSESFYSDYGKQSLIDVKLPNSLTSIGVAAFEGCNGIKNFTIPNSVTSIGVYAFAHCQTPTTFTIPNSVASIGANAFYDCTGLTSVTIGNSVTSIGSWAFGECKGLRTFTIPNSVTFLADGAFYNCTGLTNVTIGNSVPTIYGYTFEGCTGLTSVTIPNSVTSIGEEAFSGCTGLTNITIGNSVASIGKNAFGYCSGLTKITIPNSVISIGDQAFYSCNSLTSVTIGNSVTSIGSYAFEYCDGLTSILIPNSVISIGTQAFYFCSGLTGITIGNSITSIGVSAFGNCKNLASITSLNPAPPTLGLYCYTDDPAVKAVYVPAANVDSYKTAVGWRDYFYSVIKAIQ